MIPWLGGWLAGCAVPLMLQTHDPQRILAAPIAEVDGPRFDGQQLVLVFGGDHSLTPVGALLDDRRAAVTPTQQSYVLPEPGLVVFESLAQELLRRGARVYRRYDAGPAPIPDPPGSTVVVVVVEDVEFHDWITDEGEFHLVGAKVGFEIGGTKGVDTVSARVPPDRDAFVAAASALATALRGRLP